MVPYTPLKLQKHADIFFGGPPEWSVDYGTYLGSQNSIYVEGTDEIDAYRKALKHLRRLKAQADRRRGAKVMSKSYDIERTEQGMDTDEASARIVELEAALHEIRGLATAPGTRARGLIYARATDVLRINKEGASQ